MLYRFSPMRKCFHALFLLAFFIFKFSNAGLCASCSFPDFGPKQAETNAVWRHRTRQRPAA